MGSIVLFGLLVALTVVFVFGPVAGSRTGDASADRRVVLQRRKVQALQLIKDLEFDQRTGKLSPNDYEQAREEAEREAIAIMKELDALGGADVWDDEALEAEIRRIRERLAREPA